MDPEEYMTLLEDRNRVDARPKRIGKLDAGWQEWAVGRAIVATDAELTQAVCECDAYEVRGKCAIEAHFKHYLERLVWGHPSNGRTFQPF